MVTVTAARSPSFRLTVGGEITTHSGSTPCTCTSNLATMSPPLMMMTWVEADCSTSRVHSRSVTSTTITSSPMLGTGALSEGAEEGAGAG